MATRRDPSRRCGKEPDRGFRRAGEEAARAGARGRRIRHLGSARSGEPPLGARCDQRGATARRGAVPARAAASGNAGDPGPAPGRRRPACPGPRGAAAAARTQRSRHPRAPPSPGDRTGDSRAGRPSRQNRSRHLGTAGIRRPRAAGPHRGGLVAAGRFAQGDDGDACSDGARGVGYARGAARAGRNAPARRRRRSGGAADRRPDARAEADRAGAAIATEPARCPCRAGGRPLSRAG